MRSESYQECDTAGITALKFIVDDRQTCGYSWEQVCVRLPFDSIYFLICHGALMAKKKTLCFFPATETLHSAHCCAPALVIIDLKEKVLTTW